MSEAPIVIVGSGQAAAVAAKALREGGYAGRIVMVGREVHRPYERPPLSKAFLTADEEPRLSVLPDASWAQCDIELKCGVEGTRLDVHKHEIRLSDGGSIRYEMCLLATGGEVRALPALPPGTRHVHYLRTLDDARTLREVLSRRGPSIAIIGGGFLGLEIAFSARHNGCAVALIEEAPLVLSRFLPGEACAWLESTLVRTGVRLLTANSVAQAGEIANGRMQLRLRDGTRIEVDDVVVAIGLQPNNRLAIEAGLRVSADGGILVDAMGATSDPCVFACGDCTSQARICNAGPVRLESWQNANEQARAAASAMLRIPPPPPAYPWFWTDQGRHNVQMLGLPAMDLAYLRRGELAPDHPCAVWVGHRGGVPVHGVSINAGNDLRALRPLFERAQAIDFEGFSDPAVHLRAWAKSAFSSPGPAPRATAFPVH